VRSHSLSRRTWLRQLGVGAGALAATRAFEGFPLASASQPSTGSQPTAPQPRSSGGGFFPPDEAKVISEDCLHLNLWTSSVGQGGKRPVLVWFHPGAYSSMTSNTSGYDGVRLCRRGDVVVVTVNHRLNVFGYLYLAELGGADFADSGNAGMLDLVLALQWVRDNITQFGGDPKNVTIFGQSGGGAKCATLMAMPSARGLFHRVWTMSGQQITATRPVTGNKHASDVLAALSMTPDRLRDPKVASMDQLLAARARGSYFGPVKDGRSLPRDPFDPDAPPLSADIPMVFDDVALCAQMTGNPPEAQHVADQMSEALLAFARTGNPNTKAIPRWPAFSLAERPTMAFNVAAKIENDPRSDERRMFEKVPYVQPGT